MSRYRPSYPHKFRRQMVELVRSLGDTLDGKSLLTITGMAERAMMLAARRYGRTLDIATPPARPPRDAAMSG